MIRIKPLLLLAIFTVILVAGLGSLTPTVKSALAQTGDPVFVGAGDIASCDRITDEATANLLDNIPGTVFTLGDNVYQDGTLAQFNTCYAPNWGRHKSRTRPAPGNHDYHTPGAAGYFDYFGAAAGDRSKGYYSYDLGAWHIIALNSETDQAAGSAQEQWLRAELSAHPNVCTLAYWHKPRFSSGKHGNNADSQALWQALYQYRADVVLNGHDHTYERFAPQNPNGQADANGIREFVVGTGGIGLYSFSTIEPNSQVRNNTAHGVLKLTLHATSYDWQFVPIAGETFTDSGSANCVSGAAAPTFEDVPLNHVSWRYIEAFYQAGITTGCSQSPKLFCPNANVTRGEMAVFIERAMGNFNPNPSPSGMFTDVPSNFWAAKFIDEFYNDGITTGCAQGPLRYCPNKNVTRQEMAVFIERALGNFNPTPNPTGMFADVPYPGMPHTFPAFIYQFYNDGITTGCLANPLRYCPLNNVTRQEMAVFIVRAFHIPLP